MTRLDLDAARKARAEALGEPLVVVFGGEEFILPAEKPYDFAILLSRGQATDAIESLFAPDDVSRFWKHDRPPAERPTLLDVRALLDGISEHFGAQEPGESAASHSSSNGTSGS